MSFDLLLSLKFEQFLQQNPKKQYVYIYCLFGRTFYCYVTVSKYNPLRVSTHTPDNEGIEH